MATSNQLYQFQTPTLLAKGTYVAVNGPWDSHGIVLKSNPTSEGKFLNLIRGVAPLPGRKPAVQF